MQNVGNRRPLIVAGTLLGLGFSGFFDGIVLHQILQWHHMLSSNYPPTTVAGLQLNTLADGLFHSATYLLVAAGLVALWRTGSRRDVPWSTRTFVGAIFFGAGLFDVVEGTINHQILGIHHVREDVPNVLAWDLGFLVFGATLMLIGLALLQRERPEVRGTAQSLTL